ncbi:MAG TPA: PIN domain-containing protein [Acidobacteriota bacterium]|nr:PIN domain-containing protein [Acidobacteriota bacterium]
MLESTIITFTTTETVVFIDTGAFLARYIRRDQYHRKAVKAWERLRETNQRYFTSNVVLAEALTLLARWAGYKFAAERAHRIFGSRSLVILRPVEEDELDALGFFERFADQKVSFTDCVSFALMRRNRLNQVFSFDRHFTQAGFLLWP